VTDGILLEIGVCFRSFGGTHVSFDGVERFKGRDKEMDSISLRNMLCECREFMTKEERDKRGERLFELYSKTSRTKRLRMAVHNLF
jgi:hypothetical protein